MEEIVTVDGKQFKLTTDQPLTAQQKAQTIADIRKQTGCGTCGPKVAGMGNDWQYGGIYSLPNPAGGTTASSTACSKTQVGSAQTVGLSAMPTGGAASYTVTFYKQIGATITAINTVSPATEDVTQTYTYTVTDPDVAGSLGSAVATLTLSGSGTSWTASIPTLATGSIRFLTSVTDACPVASGGPGWCIQYCDIALVCAIPTCNFNVT